MRTVVVGGGVSGAHAALTLLERGHDVELWDIGGEEPDFADPGVAFHDWKSLLADPVAHLLGADLGALIPPATAELLRYPPSRRFLASPDDPLWSFESDGFYPYASFAKGGLANGWGANALSFDADDMAEWPVSISEMDAAYKTVYQRIRVAGPIDDDLTPHLPGVYPSEPPVRLSGADERLLQSYQRRKPKLARSGIKIGQARMAVTTDASRHNACDHCERCLWGCPKASIYNPRLTTLVDCEANRGFRYVSGRMVLSLLSSNHRITGIRYLDTSTQEIREEPCDVVFLAAGALQTGAIFLRTLKAARIEVALHTEGLMDTAVVKIPFVSLASVGRPSDARSFQFNRLILGMIADSPPWPRYLHGELLHLDQSALLPADRAHALRQPALEEALLCPQVGAGRGHPLLSGPNHGRKPSGAPRRPATLGHRSTVLSGVRGKGEPHPAIGFQDAVCAAAPTLPAKRCRPLPVRGGDPLRRDRADGRRAEAMRRQGTIQPLSESLHRRRRGFPVVAQQVDHDVAGRARDPRGAKRRALKNDVLFPLWQIDPQEYDCDLRLLGLTPKARPLRPPLAVSRRRPLSLSPPRRILPVPGRTAADRMEDRAPRPRDQAVHSRPSDTARPELA